MTRSRARRLVRWGLGLVLVAIAVVAWTLGRYGGAHLPVSAAVAVFAALAVGAWGLLVAYAGWHTLRLGDAGQAVARWVVPEQEWQRYIAACRMREAMPGAAPGAVPLDLPVPPQGIEVSALRGGFRVGESFHEIGTLGAEVLDVRVVDAPAAMFEFDVLYAIGKTSSVRRGVRIPIAVGAEALARRVEEYWIARDPLQTMRVEALRARERGGWTIAVLGFAAFLGVIALFVVVEPPGWAAVGPLGTLAIAGYGLVRGARARAVRSGKRAGR